MKQTWDPQGYGRNASFVPALGLPVVDWLEPRPGERDHDLAIRKIITAEFFATARVFLEDLDSLTFGWSVDQAPAGALFDVTAVAKEG